MLLPLFVLLVSGCVGGSEQALEILQSAEDKSQNISSYTGSYSISMNMDILSSITSYSMDISGAFDLWKKGGKNKLFGIMDVLLNGQQEQGSLYIYSLPDGQYVCTDEGASCQQTEETGLMMDINMPGESLQMLQGLVNNNVVTLSYLGTKNVTGRTCDNIQFNVNPNKITEAMELPVGSITPEMQDVMQNMNLYYTACMDQETGHALEFVTQMSLQGNVQSESVSMDMGMQMTATALDINADVDDSVFELPYPVSSGLL